MNTVSEAFGSKVFNDAVMKSRLPKDTYKAMQTAIREGKRLDLSVANVVANAMKDWAIEKGATHFTHWFQPLTGITAEKHDSFISPTIDGSIIMEFSGKELVQGESDASSFPSGGLRATFEARGYTAWDPTSFAFIKERVLCIPTAFCSYGGEALDKKTPLLRAMQAIDRQAMRILKLFGNDGVTRVTTTVGNEQEYFLVDKADYDRRPDLLFTGRTLFGARAPKGQELEDHYFGSIKPRVQAFMEDLNDELWELGVLAKTEHNEVAPAQHELAPIFTTTNISADHNQLTMEIMQRVAKRHSLVCLLHEKPFEGVNGSGKHNNWSLSTSTGVNLLEPGETPYENAQFLLFLCAVIQAVDDYQDLLRISVASAGNDHRLGANEAPPAIVSIFLGDELSNILEAIDTGSAYGGCEKTQMKVGVHVIPHFPKDTTDRNRTSPFAFTGNKFELRMLGSSQSVSDANTMLNTAVAESLRIFADTLESATDFTCAVHELILKVVKEHKRIIFNGNGYDDAWVKEAERRGLLNLKTTPDCLSHFVAPKNIELLKSHKVLSETEIRARLEIMLENYKKIVCIEAMTMIDMTRKDILPASVNFQKKLADAIAVKHTYASAADCTYETDTLITAAALTKAAYDSTRALEDALAEARAETEAQNAADICKDKVLKQMSELRASVDALEILTATSDWPYPSYGDILFNVR
ncbi:MAG: glutamine synthetase type III [Clostridiales bacterium]|nr:glutamine synthetase type III [Clostridiales bacterium]